MERPIGSGNLLRPSSAPGYNAFLFFFKLFAFVFRFQFVHLFFWVHQNGVKKHVSQMAIFLLRFCAIVNDFYQFPGSREYFQTEFSSNQLKTVPRKWNLCFQEIQITANNFYQLRDSMRYFQAELSPSLLKTVPRK